LSPGFTEAQRSGYLRKYTLVFEVKTVEVESEGHTQQEDYQASRHLLIESER
jgi:hypothetical protein